jgi:hypothetical protein
MPKGAPAALFQAFLRLTAWACYGLQSIFVGQPGPGSPSAFRIVGIDSAPSSSRVLTRMSRVFFTVELLCVVLGGSTVLMWAGLSYSVGPTRDRPVF